MIVYKRASVVYVKRRFQKENALIDPEHFVCKTHIFPKQKIEKKIFKTKKKTRKNKTFSMLPRFDPF